MAKTTAGSAHERLLDVAEELLLDAGYDDVSVRSINAAAGMNPAAVHYHFGSKEALVAALLQRRFAPFWQERLDHVAARRKQGWTPTVDELVDIVLAPLTTLAADPARRLQVRLLSRFVLGGHGGEWTAKWFRLEPWVELLRAARPDLSEDAAGRRWLLATYLILQVFGAPLVDAASDTPPSAEQVDALRLFVRAGLDAP